MSTQNEKEPMTLLERRQKKAIENLVTRRNRALEFIELHTQRLEEKLQPYRDEIKIVETMLEQSGVKIPADGEEGASDA